MDIVRYHFDVLSIQGQLNGCANLHCACGEWGPPPLITLSHWEESSPG